MQGNLGGILQVHKLITGQVPGLCNLMVEKHQHPKRKILKLNDVISVNYRGDTKNDTNQQLSVPQTCELQ